MDLKRRLNRISEKLKERGGGKPPIIIFPKENEEDMKRKIEEFKAKYGRDCEPEVIIIQWKKSENPIS